MLTCVHFNLQATGLIGLLTDPNAQNTIFAPTDDAFNNLQQQTGVSTPELFANTNLLQQVPCHAELRYAHVLCPGVMFYRRLCVVSVGVVLYLSSSGGCMDSCALCERRHKPVLCRLRGAFDFNDVMSTDCAQQHRAGPAHVSGCAVQRAAAAEPQRPERHGAHIVRSCTCPHQEFLRYPVANLSCSVCITNGACEHCHHHKLSFLSPKLLSKVP